MPESESFRHEPVLYRELFEAVAITEGDQWVDGTFGRGGHTRGLLERGARVLALDRDEEAERAAAGMVQEWPGRLMFRRANFSEFARCCDEAGWSTVEGVLLDLGSSSPQFDQAERGFSFRQEGPLDMRMDRRSGLTAAEIVNTWSEHDLAKIFNEHGDEKESRRIARAIVARRQMEPFRVTVDLAKTVADTIPWRRAVGVHPATKVFQALRIVVNGEQEALMSVLPQAMQRLKPGGVLAVISFHSGEDRVVKYFMKEHSQENLDLPSAPIPVPNPKRFFNRVKRYLPGEEEVSRNPRARSARLRVAWRNEVPYAA